MGKVYLVGAGCGSLDLYTVKAMRCIQKADCLIYDHLIDQRILEFCKKDCEKIYVGKRASHHILKQPQINDLLVKKARQLDCVVRLKGGDVFVFGRGGEEGQVLFENHIDFEVIPGVSSAIAGLSYAGIPITHRHLSGGFHVYSAHLQNHQERQFDFSTMLDDYCTYVFLMGIAKLDMIVDGFKKAGKNQDTPVAIISQASFPSQRCLIGTLSDIQDRFQKQPLPTPGIIVVGHVVSMRKYLNFYETLPLFSKKALVTTVGQDHDLYDQLHELGADITEVMTGKVIYRKVKIPDLEGYIILTSQHGVIGFMQNYLAQYKDLRHLSKVKIICIGEKTNQKLNEYGLNADYMPHQPYSDCLNQELQELAQKHKLYLVQGEKSHLHSWLFEQVFQVYQNKKIQIESKNEHYDYGFFTCASSVKRFHEMNQSTCDVFVSIGLQTTKAIQKYYGHVKIIEALYPAKKEMVKAVLRREKNVL